MVVVVGCDGCGCVVIVVVVWLCCGCLCGVVVCGCVVLLVAVVVVSWRCLASCVVVCSCLFVSDVKEVPRKNLPMMFSLINNEG